MQPVTGYGLAGNDYHLGDPATVVHDTHGRRLYDTLKEYCHINDESKLQVRLERDIWDSG
jgi:hypothetical protein